MDYDPRSVRAWTAANGIKVAPQSSVAREVVDAWRQANTPALRMAG